VPRHKGGIDLETGLYVREDEDLVVRGMPGLVLRRTYLSRDRQSRHFGVGTTHNGERYLRGDGDRFQWIELILAKGTRIRFERVSPGTSILNAVYEDRSGSSEFGGAKLGWVGTGWALSRRDGSLLQFLACGPGVAPVCAIAEERDADGHAIRYQRDSSARLLRMETTDNRWIAFEYDERNRIIRAHDSSKHAVRYDYDDHGRLSDVTEGEGVHRRYDYTPKDEMSVILEPGKRIENVYEEGRCVRQINTWPGQAAPFVFAFNYVVKDGVTIQTDVSRSDETWARFTYDGARRVASESWGASGVPTSTFTYQRDALTHALESLTLECPGRSGALLRHSSDVRPGYEDWTKWDLVRTHCSTDSRDARGD
jgi:YD repeat-containing protein